MVKHRLCESQRASLPHRHMHVYELSYMVGRVGPAGLSLFAAIEGHTKGVYSVRPLPRIVSRLDLLYWKHQNKSEE